MKNRAATILAFGLLYGTAAHAEKWVEFGIHGSGNFDEINYDPDYAHSGEASFDITAYVELDPADFADLDDMAYYDAGPGFFDQHSYYSGDEWLASVNGEGLSFAYDNGTDSYGYADWNAQMSFAPGSIDGAFPSDFSKTVVLSTIRFEQNAHYYTLRANGSAHSVSARLVDAPGDWNFAITRTAVPEPVSWALMLGGFGAVGATLRYSRRRGARSVAAASAI